MPTAALFSSNFLEYSQTFVHDELRAHDRWDVEVFTRFRMNQERFDYEPVHVGGLGYALTTVHPRFERLFRSGAYRLVHAHFGPGALYATPYAARFDLPLLVTFHGYDVPLLGSAERFVPKNWPYALLAPRMLRQLTLGLCASRELREMLIAHGVPAEKLVDFPIGIDLSRFTPGEKDREALRVIMVGRFVEKKGFEYGIRAFAQAAERVPGARLTLVGRGKREPLLRALVAEHGLAGRVTFAGELSHDEVARAIQRSHVLLAPSVVAADGNRESGLLSVKEASACETVPIGTYHGGIPESIDDGETGFLVPERAVDAMADRLVTLLEDRPLRERMARAARAKMERDFDIRKRVAVLEDLYDRVVDDRR